MDFKKFTDLVMIEQTLFTLPFAYLGLLFAGGGSVLTWLWVTLALTGARVAGMSFNRIIDRDIDGRNQRTSDRHQPAGRVSSAEVLLLGIGASILLIFASFMLNSLCFYLSFLAILLLVSYSYFKRFTAASHFYLGFVEAAAPIGGYLAETGEFSFLPFLLGFAIMMWIAGLDIVYALQNTDFDRREGLQSLPARFGREKSLRISAVSCAASFAALATAGGLTGRGIAFWTALLCVGLIFLRQQKLARSEDAAAAIKEFIQINACISPILFVGTFIDVFIK
jgi:4-hydroxybenzoate polyprenyltransferase